VGSTDHRARSVRSGGARGRVRNSGGLPRSWPGLVAWVSSPRTMARRARGNASEPRRPHAPAVVYGSLSGRNAARRRGRRAPNLRRSRCPTPNSCLGRGGSVPARSPRPSTNPSARWAIKPARWSSIGALERAGARLSPLATCSPPRSGGRCAKVQPATPAVGGTADRRTTPIAVPLRPRAAHGSSVPNPEPPGGLR